MGEVLKVFRPDFSVLHLVGEIRFRCLKCYSPVTVFRLAAAPLNERNREQS